MENGDEILRYGRDDSPLNVAGSLYTRGGIPYPLLWAS
jgi:hypothetical protein